MTAINTLYPQVTIYNQDIQKFISAKKIWAKIKDTKLCKRLRESGLNPYHSKLNFYDAPKKEAILMAREKGDKAILFRGENGYKTRCFVELDCSVAEEKRKYNSIFRGGHDVTDKIPVGKDGKPDLFAEEPIVVAIVPMEGPSLVGHVCMQYKDKVINRRSEFMDTAPIWETYGLAAQYYFIYPSKIGIDPKKFEHEMEKTNIRKGDEVYNIGYNNCAVNVYVPLKKCGVKINMLGHDNSGMVFATPGNNPFGFGIKNWCLENGVHVRPQEMLQYRHRNFENADKKMEEYADKRERYKSMVEHKKQYT